MSTFHTIDTPQNVRIDLPLGSLSGRMGAYMIDGFIKLAWMIFWLILLVGAFEISGSYIIYFLVFIPVLLYTFLFERFYNGQTPGKMMMNLQVISVDGSKVSTGQYLIRWLFQIVDFYLLTYLVAIFSIGFGGKGQRLGDLVAGTMVISTKSPTVSMKFDPNKFDERYEVRYPQAEQLTMKEVQLIREILANTSDNQFHLVTKLAEKLEQNYNMTKLESSRDFLRRLISDKAFLEWDKAKILYE